MAQVIQRREPTGKVEGATIALRAKRALDVFAATGSGFQALTTFVFPAIGIGGGWNAIGEAWGSSYYGFDGNGEDRDGYHAGRLDYWRANAYNSSVVMACIGAITASLKLAQPKVYKVKGDGTKVPLPNHNLMTLLRRPNPYYSMRKLLGACSISYNLTGNAYVFKEKMQDGLGATQALYYIPHYMIQPRRPLTGGSYVGWYEYLVNGRTYRLRTDQVIHLRYDLDPYNTLMGRNPLQPVLSTIYSDEEADLFVAALLRNTAMPGVTIIPEQGVTVKPADAQALKDNFKSKFGGERRGEPLVLGFAGKVEQMGFNPEQMQMKDARRLPEERVAAQYRIAPAFAGLGAGLDRSTYSNYEQAERHSYETGIVPIWDEWGEDLTTAFIAEFFQNNPAFTVEFDYSNVKALNDSQDSVINRNVKLWQFNAIDRAQLLSNIGLPVDDATDKGVFYSDTKPLAPPTGVVPTPNTLTGLPDSGKGERRLSLTERLRLASARLSKTGLDGQDRAYDMTLEAEVREISGTMTGELDSLFISMARKAQDSARNLDRHNPKAETDRITGAIFEQAGVIAYLLLSYQKMAEDATDAGRISVALRLGVDFKEAWNEGAQAHVTAAWKAAADAYEAALLDQTRKAVGEAIRMAEQGESAASIARTIKSMVQGRYMYPGLYQEGYEAAKQSGASEDQAIRAGEAKASRYRATLIAEAETRTAQNVAALEAMLASGVVESVRVSDGDKCGWREHNDKDKADGSIRLLSDARRYPYVHPHCKRRFFPLKREGV